MQETFPAETVAETITLVETTDLQPLYDRIDTLATLQVTLLLALGLIVGVLLGRTLWGWLK